MTNQGLSPELSGGNAKPEAATPHRRPRFRPIAFFPLWLTSMLLLGMAIAAAVAYLMSRRPDVVEIAAPPPAPAELAPEVVRRADALRALNSMLAEQIETLRRQMDQQPCPPGTAIQSNESGDKTSPNSAPTPVPDAHR